MRFRALLCVVLFARLADAQARDTTGGAPRTTVSGIVHDSIGGKPLAGSVVQLVASGAPTPLARTAISDSLGRFTLDDVPAGRYMLGFFHPMLDSLGVEPPVREVNVAGGLPVRADLAIPSPARLRAAICGARAAADSGALVLGVVRDARDGVPAAGVKVEVIWAELAFGPEGLTRRMPRHVITTAANGWFARCNIPSTGTIALSASRGADSTDLIEVDVPAERFLRRDLYLGPARIVVIGGAPRADTLAPPSRRRTGDGRLTGVVVTAVEGTPLAGAQVGIRDGPRVNANERGEWALVGAPLGTRMLEVRAVGYYPEHRAVDVVPGAAPIRTALLTMKAVLDTVEVTASRLNENRRGFEERRRGGIGRFLTPEDVARRQPIVTSDLFRMVPGMQVERSELGDTQVTMRGIFSERCTPAVYLDSHFMMGLTADDIDGWVKPNEIAGIEIYVGASVPAQFNPGIGAGGLSHEPCGSIVIWTKPASGLRPSSWKGRVVRVLGLAVAAVGIRALFDTPAMASAR